MKGDENIANLSALAEIIERRKKLQRNDSFTTVTSSEGKAFVKQQYEDIAKLAAISDNVLVLDSINSANVNHKEGLHVGDKIYVTYVMPTEKSNCSNCSDNCNNHNTNIENRSDSPDSVISLDNDSIFKKVGDKKCLWIYMTCTLIAFIFVCGITIAGILFIIHQNDPTDGGINSCLEELCQTEYSTTSSNPPLESESELLVPRLEWGADSPKSQNISRLTHPIKRIIIGHTGGNACCNKTECVKAMKFIQSGNSALDDIPHNFLIGGDGRIYEGRGFNFEGQHTANLDATDYNNIGIDIAFIGNYQDNPPSSDQLDILKRFIEFYVEQKIIAEDYKIFLQDELIDQNVKADALKEVIENYDNFISLYKIHRRNTWGGQRHRTIPTKFSKVMSWILIGHTESAECENYDACAAKVRSLQSESFDRSFDDIMYNFVVGGDGIVFEGRGWDNVAAHAGYLNSLTIGIGVIGNFAKIKPNDGIINSILKILDDAMMLGKLTNDYTINGRSDFKGPGPGDEFMKIIQGWCRYGNRTKPC